MTARSAQFQHRSHRRVRAASVVIVGAGPRGTSLLERLIANASELLPGRPLTVHIVDPYPAGAGHLWRRHQSSLLWANSMVQDVTMFTDESCRTEGPIAPGPSFLDWARRQEPSGFGDPALEHELQSLDLGNFPSRCLLAEYLSWVFGRIVRSAPPDITVEVHADSAIDIEETGDGQQMVWLGRRAEPLVADFVLLAQGHLSSEPVGVSREIGRRAREYALTYVPEEYVADVDLSGLGPSDDVLVRGAGLTFIDLLVLLTQGRGGRFREAPDGTLIYLPSGQEPRLHVGSRRGVPYRAKITYPLQGPAAPHPRFLDDAAVEKLLAAGRSLDFAQDVWPLLVKELAFGYYHELFSAHPAEVRATWPGFEAELAKLDWGSPELAAIVADAVPHAVDRFDPRALDRPLAGIRLRDQALQRWMIAHITADLARRRNPRFSADLALCNALLASLGPLRRLLGGGVLSAASDGMSWFVGFFSYLAAGPPPRRLRELVALTQAGVVRFLGAEVRISAEPSDSPRDVPAAFAAESATVARRVRAGALVEARLPKPSVSRSTDPLLRALYRRGEAVEQTIAGADGTTKIGTGRLLISDDFHVLDATGRSHPRRLSFGAGTSAATPGTFSRPRANAAFFRQNDAAVRAVLSSLADDVAAHGPVLVASRKPPWAPSPPDRSGRPTQSDPGRRTNPARHPARGQRAAGAPARQFVPATVRPISTGTAHPQQYHQPLPDEEIA